MKVLFLPEVEDFLYELMEILYKKEYFGYKESAVEYVTELENDIKTNLPNKLKRPAPQFFNKYGKKLLYSTFQKNNNTQWYVFFNIYESNKELIFLVKYISNNHVIAQYM